MHPFLSTSPNQLLHEAPSGASSIPLGDGTSRFGLRAWFLASLLFALICGILGLHQAFRAEYVVQDDARQHVFWMQRFLDPGLFPNDMIADYFQSVAPIGYTALYWIMAKLGIPPLLFHKLLPLFLGLIITGYCFFLCLEILPVPFAGFLATVLLNQSLWLRFDLVSATPRAFVYPLLLAFLYYLLRRSLIPCLTTMALQGLFYPHALLISAAILILRLLRWEQGGLRFSPDRKDYLFCFFGLGIALLAMLPFLLKSSEFGPAMTAAQARDLPEFQPGGRSPFFYHRTSKYWLTGRLGGMFPPNLFKHKPLFLGFFLPILLLLPFAFPLSKQIKPGIALFPQAVLSSLAMFFAAHAFLFRLHLPSRYTQHTFRILMALAAAVTLTVTIDAILHRIKRNPSVFPRRLTQGGVALVAIALVIYPAFLPNFPVTNYVVGKHPSLYQFFSRQPKEILIASLAQEADNLPTFSQRSVLVSREFAIPYHQGYYSKFRQRALDLIRAQYTHDLRELQEFIRKYRVDFWLLERNAFTMSYVSSHPWMREFKSEVRDIRQGLERGAIPALAGFLDGCSVFEDKRFVVLKAEYIGKARAHEAR